MLFHLVFMCNKQLTLAMLYFQDLQYLDCLNFWELVMFLRAILNIFHFLFLFKPFKGVHALELMIEEFKYLFKYLVVFLLLKL